MKVAPTYLLPPRRSRAQEARRAFLIGSLAISVGLLGGAYLLRRPAFAEAPRLTDQSDVGPALVGVARQLAAPESPDTALLEQRLVFLAGFQLAPEDSELWRGASRLTGLLVASPDLPDRDHCVGTIQSVIAQQPEAARIHAPLLEAVLHQIGVMAPR